MKTVLMKLLSGEEVIARENGDGTYSKARVLRFMPDGQGGAKAGLVPFLMAAPDAALPVNKGLVLTEIECPSDVEAAYIEATSDIVLAR